MPQHTAFLKSLKSNVALSVYGFFTNSETLIEDRQQAPFFFSGCSYVLSQRLFILCIWRFLSYFFKIRLSIQTSTAYIFSKAVPYSWASYCSHSAHHLCVTFPCDAMGTRYYHANWFRLHRFYGILLRQVKGYRMGSQSLFGSHHRTP